MPHPSAIPSLCVTMMMNHLQKDPFLGCPQMRGAVGAWSDLRFVQLAHRWSWTSQRTLGPVPSTAEDRTLEQQQDKVMLVCRASAIHEDSRIDWFLDTGPEPRWKGANREDTRLQLLQAASRSRRRCKRIYTLVVVVESQQKLSSVMIYP